jgi:hypothetical protein
MSNQSVRDIDKHNFEIEIIDPQGRQRLFAAGEMYPGDWSLIEVTHGPQFFVHGPLHSRVACLAAAQAQAASAPPRQSKP